MPKVSIIVPVYNVEQYLEQCVNSLLAQTMQDIEILLVDDGSSDGSGKLCDQLRERDPRIHVIHQANQGVSVARNAGISASRGEWITFVDGDDWAAPELCEETTAFAQKLDADLVIFSYYSVYANESKRSRLTDLPQGDVTSEKEYIIKKTISQYYGGKVSNNGVSAGTTWGKLIRRSEIVEHKLHFQPGLTRAQDTVFWLRGFEFAKKIAVLDKALYYYRISNTSICSGTKYLPACEIPFGMLLEEYRRYIVEFSKGPEYEKAFSLRVIQVLSWHLKHKILHKQNTQPLGAKLSALRQLSAAEPFKSSIRDVELSWLPRSLLLLALCCRTRMYFLYYLVYEMVILRKDRTLA